MDFLKYALMNDDAICSKEQYFKHIEVSVYFDFLNFLWYHKERIIANTEKRK